MASNRVVAQNVQDNGVLWHWRPTRSVASGLALGNICWKVRGLSTGRLSSIVAAKGDWMAEMSSVDGRPVH